MSGLAWLTLINIYLICIHTYFCYYNLLKYQHQLKYNNQPLHILPQTYIYSYFTHGLFHNLYFTVEMLSRRMLHKLLLYPVFTHPPPRPKHHTNQTIPLTNRTAYPIQVKMWMNAMQNQQPNTRVCSFVLLFPYSTHIDGRWTRLTAFLYFKILNSPHLFSLRCSYSTKDKSNRICCVWRKNLKCIIYNETTYAFSWTESSIFWLWVSKP